MSTADAVGRCPYPARALPRAGDAWPWVTATGGVALVVGLAAARAQWIDTSFDLYAGRFLVQHGLPHVDLLTAAARGREWLDQQWLGHLLVYGTWAAGGYPALALVFASVVAATFALVARLLTRRGVPPARAFGWALLALLPFAGHASVRAQTLAYPLFVALLGLLSADARRPGFTPAALWPVAVLAVWGNVHGSVVLAAGLTAVYALWRAAAALHRRAEGSAGGYALLAVLAPLGLAANPYGFAILRYYRAVLVNPVIAGNVGEWRPSGPAELWSALFLGFGLAVAVAVARGWRRGSRPEPVTAAVALALFVLAVRGVRFQPWFLLAGPLLAAGLPVSSRPPVPRRLSVAVATVMSAAAFATGSAVAVMPAAAFQQDVPSGAVDAAAAYTDAHPGALLLADEAASTDLLWRHPQTAGRVGFDVRYEQYRRADLLAYFRFLRAPRGSWQALTADYDVIVVSRRVHPALATAVGHLAGWRVLDRDADGLVVVRD